MTSQLVSKCGVDHRDTGGRIQLDFGSSGLPLGDNMKKAARLLAAVIAIAFSAGSAFAQSADLFGGDWSGAYMCQQGQTPMTLLMLPRDDGSVTAAMEFTVGDTKGSYRLTGRPGRDGSLKLVPANWIRRPEGFEMVGLTGRLEGSRFSGRIDHSACGEFSVQLTAPPAPIMAAPRSPSAASPAPASQESEVSVYVPGFDAWVRGPVNTPLNPLWPESKYKIVPVTQQGYDTVAEGDNFLSYTFRVRTPSFLPLETVNTVGFWDSSMGIVPIKGRAGWPNFLNERVAIWGMDGYAVPSSGGHIQNWISYFATRQPSKYMYIQYFLINEQACFNWTGCQQNYMFLGNERASYYSQAMIVPVETLQRPVEFSTQMIYSGQGPRNTDAQAARALAMVAGAIAGAGVIQEMRKPLGAKILDAQQACEERRRQVEGGIIVC